LRVDAGTKVWVCEEGHVDDHHVDLRNHGVEPGCSRCGGTCQQFSLDGLAREYRERLRVNVGLITENRQLKDKLAGSEQGDGDDG
jgi:hypothetical protein